MADSGIPLAALSLSSAQPQPPVNPLDNLTKMMAIQGGMNQNKLFQLDLQAREATGAAAQQSIDPQSGEMDYGKFASIISQDPRTALRAPEMLNQLAQRQVQQQEAKIKQLTLAKDRLSLVGKSLSNLVPMGDTVTRKHLINEVGSLVGAIGDPDTTKFMTAALATAPVGGAPLAQWIKTHALQVEDNAARVDMMLGKFNTINTGNTQLTQIENAYKGTVTPVRTVPMGMTPGEAATPVKGPVGPDGQPTEIYKGDTRFGGGGPRTAAPVPGPTGTVAGPVTPTAGTVQTETPAPVASVARPSGTFATEPPPMMKTFMEEMGKNTSKYMDDIHTAVQTLPTKLKRLDEMQSALSNFESGPGEETRVKLAQAAQALGWKDIAQKISRGSLPDAQFVRAMIAQQAIENLKTVAEGTGRVMRSEVDVFLANESLSTDPHALEKILNFMRSSYSNLKDQTTEFPKFKQGLAAGKIPGDISDFLPWYIQNHPERFQTEQKSGIAKGAAKEVHWTIKDGKLFQEAK